MSVLADLEGLKLAAALVLLSPFVPLLFMGEEYGETAPFLYFTSHGDPDLVEAVRRGRQEEFSRFRRVVSPPDPQDEATYLSCRLQRGVSRHGHHEVLLRFYKALTALRKEISSDGMDPGWEVKEVSKESVLLVRSFSAGRQVARIYHFGKDRFRASVPLPPGSWHKKIDSWDAQWMGPGGVIPSTLESKGLVAMEFPCRGMIVMEMVEG